MSLDFPTITVLGFLLCIGIAVGFSLLLVVLRGQPVLRLWTASLWLLTLGVTLLALRPYLPLAPAILAGNAAMAGCAVLMLRGVALHLEQPLPLWRPLLMAAAFMAGIFAFLVLWPDLGVRLQVFSVFTLLVDGWIAWLLLRHAPVQQRTSCRLAAAVFLAEAALYAVRLFLPVAPDAGEDIMRTGTPMFVTYLAGVMLELARCFAMVLLLVERMLVDLRRAARTDGLTGLLNRSAVLADGQAQLQRMRRQGRHWPCCWSTSITSSRSTTAGVIWPETRYCATSLRCCSTVCRATTRCWAATVARSSCWCWPAARRVKRWRGLRRSVPLCSRSRRG